MVSCLKAVPQTSEFRQLISGFHRALLQSITFISGLMHSIIQSLEVKIYIV